MKLAAKQLEHVSRLVLKALGCKEKEAVIVSKHLVEANLRGHPSHGVGILPFYVDSVRNDTLRPNQPARLVRDAGAILQFSGERGFGQRVAREAVDAAIWRVRETGVALLTIRNAHHMGRIGCYGEQLANAGLVGLFFVNVTDFPSPMVAPFGGTAGRFGGNPICIAFPGTDKHPAFILDFATSRVSYGKTRVAYLAGKRFDEPVMLDHAGHPTHDPRVMWEEPQGTLRPLAHHKGGGLLAATEFLAGLLSGGGTTQPERPRQGGILNQMTAFVVDPAQTGSLPWLQAEYDAMTEYIKSSPAHEGSGPVQMAGEPEARRRAEHLANGIEFSDNEWNAIRTAALEAGVMAHQLDEVQELA